MYQAEAPARCDVVVPGSRRQVLQPVTIETKTCDNRVFLAAGLLACRSNELTHSKGRQRIERQDLHKLQKRRISLNMCDGTRY
jgi:hypothetical protein